jgi:very-short-patch-repair endonuclease
MKETRNSKPRIDLTGQQFGRWTVLEYVKSNKWKCQCSCKNHTIKLVDGRNLRRGMTLSCGCLQKEKTSEANSIDLTGQKFGMLLATQRIKENKYTYYICNCDCGNKNIKVDGRNLKSGHTTSCGCIKSKGEFIIASFLREHHINFIKEKKFSDCKDIQELPFDFYLIDLDILIEYDGEQHFQLSRFGNKTKEEAEENLKKYQYHDAIKTQWCKDNNKKLIRLNYKDFNTLEEKLRGELCLQK